MLLGVKGESVCKFFGAPGLVRMTLLSREYLLKSLINLLPTEEQMKSVGLYIRTFKRDHEAIIEGWEFVYHRASIYHKLNLLYLANEVVQTTKDMDSDSMSLKLSFKKAVNNVFRDSKEESKSNGALHKKYCDLESVWIQRSVMSLESHGISLEELLRSIEASFGDRAKLVETLERTLAQLKK
jgi:regulator of Ty1 transposition protein 103